MSSDLVKRLRCSIPYYDLSIEAADRIEALEADVSALKMSNDLFVGANAKASEMNTQLTVQLHAERARAERLRVALSDAVAWMNGCAVSGGYPAWHAKALRTLEDDKQ